jgi:hypothetical protein
VGKVNKLTLLSSYGDIQAFFVVGVFGCHTAQIEAQANTQVKNNTDLVRSSKSPWRASNLQEREGKWLEFRNLRNHGNLLHKTY